MACDPNALLTQAVCVECEVPPGLVPYVILAKMMQITGTTIEEILAALPCYQCTIPPEMVGYTLLVQECNLIPPEPPPVPADARFTEDSQVRFTEDSQIRVIE